MQIKATYNRGCLEFSVPIRLSRDEFTVLVDLPDDVVLSTEAGSKQEKSAPSSEEAGSELLAKFRRILGSMHRQRPSASVGEDKDAYAEALGEKYGQ
ncbi:hypothetical protein Dthio_PD0167 [Desulfonatronospira thiodismutans ASO3-1]|uniref:Uncharacterized protein n=1 Tax=Desulfonatronospira thiodismutans ASO3-1 TaxID=555779 RepID=D6SU79_9BACT|nr:hypothetical protein [Desulfonatronospira thiodismutans]EFI32859.1 hypothetical protein Dthio_PD0167 [Desulfonatronospira thiodismutans ASO3-1]